MPVSVSFDYPPIPIRSADWSACIDGQEEDGPYGRGETREKALVDLGVELADADDIEGFVDVLVALIEGDIEKAKNDNATTAYILGLKSALATVRGII